MTDPNQLNGTSLAYLGDAVLELLTREHLLTTGITDVGTLNKMALDYVRAVKQSECVERILPLLDEEENDMFRRGRNAHGISAPKSASVGQYRRATGMEALFAFLYLKGRGDRMRTLFRAAYQIEEE